jgi:purine-cytosine permease-like protein
LSDTETIPPPRRRISIGRFSVPVPGSRLARVVLGVGLVLCGMVGFLPILGFWMIPLGFLVLSVDLPIVRRQRRRVEVWWGRRNKPKNGGTNGVQ